MTFRRPRQRFVLHCLLINALIAAACSCSSVAYRVPSAEVGRLAQRPPGTRGDEVRVVPWNGLTPTPEVVASEAVAVEAPPPPMAPEVTVDVSIPIVGPGRIEPAPVATRQGVLLPARVPLRTATVIRGGPPPVRPIAAPPRPTGSGGWRGASATSFARPSIPASRVHAAHGGGGRGGGGHGGGGHGGGHGGGEVAAVAGVIAVIGLVAILAAVAESSSEADEARNFDGWVTVDSTHVLHLFYTGNVERGVPLSALRPEDAVGLLYAILREDDGPIIRLHPLK